MSRSIHVLMIEDNPGDAELTKEILEASKNGVEVTVASDGAEALELLRAGILIRSEQPDLILLDLNLPKLSGQHVLLELKRDESLRGIPVVVLTSSEAANDVTASYMLGASCYLTKPLGLEAFQSTIRAVESFWLMLTRLP